MIQITFNSFSKRLNQKRLEYLNKDLAHLAYKDLLKKFDNGELSASEIQKEIGELTDCILLFAHNGNIKAMKFFIEDCNIDPNYQGIAYDNNTFLHYASSNADLELVKFLLTQGANPCLQNKFHNTPIDIAETYGYFEILNELKLVAEDLYNYNSFEAYEQMAFLLSNFE